MSDHQASKAMCDQHNIRLSALYRFFNNCDPLFTNWVVPIALLDAHKFWM